MSLDQKALKKAQKEKERERKNREKRIAHVGEIRPYHPDQVAKKEGYFRLAILGLVIVATSALVFLNMK
jgi:Skp family chaperone for outer membrane proteins